MNTAEVVTSAFGYWVEPAPMSSSNLFEKSATYAACEKIIEMPFMIMQLSHLDEMLQRLENNGRLTHREHQSLLDLGRKKWQPTD